MASPNVVLSKLSDMINAKLRETFKRLSIFEMLIIFLFLLWNTGKASPTDLPGMYVDQKMLVITKFNVAFR